VLAGQLAAGRLSNLCGNVAEGRGLRVGTGPDGKECEHEPGASSERHIDDDTPIRQTSSIVAGSPELLDSRRGSMARSDRHWHKIETHLKQWAAELDRARLSAEEEVAKVQTQYYQRLTELRADIEQSLRRWEIELKALKQQAGTTESELARGIEDFRTRLKDELNAWQPDLEQLRRTAVQAKAEAKRMTAELRVQGKLATKRLVGLKQTAGQSWDEIRPAIERAWAELRPALRSAAAKFREPRPPASSSTGAEPGPHEERTRKD